MDAQDPVTIKTEIDSITVEENTISIEIEHESLIKTEPVTHLEEISDQTQEHPFGSIQVAVKDESNVIQQDIIEQEHNSLLVERGSNSTETVPVAISITPHIEVAESRQNSIYPIGLVQTDLQSIKEEKNDESLVSYDYPNFDDVVSMDSNEAVALGNVEACIQDDVNVKYENDMHYDDQHKQDFNNANVKMESDMTITETHLTSTNQNSLGNASSSHTKHPFILKIPEGIVSNFDHLVTSCPVNGSSYCKKPPFDDPYPIGDICKKPVDSKQNLEYECGDSNEYYDDGNFQLNSITGNCLSLDQEAYLIKSQQDVDSGKLKILSCPKCIKKFLYNYQLRKHLKVHQRNENYAKGKLKGIKTRKRNQANKLKMLAKLDKKLDKEPNQTQPQPKPEQKEGYKCTCGSTFKRRSRLETCLRSHNLFESDSIVICSTCSKKFKTKEELWLHRKRFHRKKFPCKFCPTDYETRKQLFKHLQLHQKVQLMEYKVIEEYVNGKKKIQCFMCPKTWTKLSDLKTHVMTDHESPYTCPHCKNTFARIIDFGSHTKTYHPEVGGQSVLDVLEAFSRLVQGWKCAECNIQFFEADKLALHQMEKHYPQTKTNAQFQCPDCRRVFVSQKGLTSHRRIHHSTETSAETKPEEMGILCLECRKICKDMNALTSHMRLHSLDRKYPCKFCDFRFATPEKRKAHAEVHTGDMKFVCFICEYQCSSENRLKQHKLSPKHVNMKEYLLTGKPLVEASSSKEKVKDKKDCSARKRKKTEESVPEEDSKPSSSEVACDVCGEKFSSEQEMLDHKQIHPFIEFPSDDKPTRIFFK